MRAIRFWASILALAACVPAHGVVLSENGRGQALVFPYYTTRTAIDGTFNTLVSITNASTSVKALKVVLREGKAGKWAGEWNVYLAAGDMWTAGLVPDVAGMRLITTDLSCTDPAFPTEGIPVSASFLTFTPDDGLGTDVERIREGYIEVFEMGVLTGNARTYAGAAPRNCNALRAMSPNPDPFAAPSGGLAGGAYLVNVTSARGFSYDAIALDALASQPYFGIAQFDDVSFNATAIDPVSVVTFGGTTYRSRWTKPVDAVTAVLMTREIEGEYVMDAGTASRTDWVLTFPTRRHYVTTTSASGPFHSPLGATGTGCEWLYVYQQRRDDVDITSIDFPERPPPGTYACWSATVITFLPGFVPLPASSYVFGSHNVTPAGAGAEHGWARVDLPAGALFSADTMAFSHASGTTSAMGLTLQGLPVVGFAATTFNNGFLDCNGVRCKGNYGATFKLRPRVNESLG